MSSVPNYAYVHLGLELQREGPCVVHSTCYKTLFNSHGHMFMFIQSKLIAQSRYTYAYVGKHAQVEGNV